MANGAATAADWMSAASFISMAGLVSTLGYDGSIYLMGWTGGYVLLALLLAPFLRKFGKYTVPDFVGDRYYSRLARVVAVICAVFVSVTYVAGQMRGVGIVFSRFLQVDIDHGVFIGMLIVTFFAVLGGMKGITWTQVAQYSVLIVAYLIPAVALAWMLTGNPVPQIAFTTSDIVERLNQIQADLGFAEYTSPFANKPMQDVLFITIALMVGTAGLPHVIVRFYTVKSVRAARYSAGWALFFIAILYTSAPALAAFARYNLVTGLHDKSIEEIQATQWVSKWTKTGLLEFNDKNGDGRIQLNAEPAFSEVTIDRDIIVLSTPEVAALAPWVIALVAAGGSGRGTFHRFRSAPGHLQFDCARPLLPPNQPESRRTPAGVGGAGDDCICRLCGRLFRHSSHGFCRSGRCLRLRSGRGQFLSGRRTGNFRQTHQPRRRYCRYDRRPRIHHLLHHGDQIFRHAPVARDLGRRYRNGGHASEFRGHNHHFTPDTTTATGHTGHGRSSSIAGSPGSGRYSRRRKRRVPLRLGSC